MVISIFEFDNSQSGNIAYIPPATYTIATGYANCVIEYVTFINREKRAFFLFNTASLPDNAIITKIEFNIVEAITQPANRPDRFTISIGDFGTTLDSGDWNSGSVAYTDISFPIGWVELDSSYVNLVSKTSYTGIKITGQYSGILTQGRNYNQLKSKCQLKVTWHVPIKRKFLFVSPIMKINEV